MSKDQRMQQHEIEYQGLLEPSRRALNKRQRVDSDEKINPSAPEAAKSNVLPPSPQQAMDDKNKEPPFGPAFSSEERDRQLTRFLDFTVDGSDGDFEEEEEDAVARMRAQVAQTVQARVSFDDSSSDEEYALSKVPLNDDDSGNETSFEGAEILYGEDVDVEMKDLDDREDEEGEWMLV
ncbi:unnamed protein product [Aureobasidium pullulans]|nr:unnamed protein product [Aureobasidium pullulans]